MDTQAGRWPRGAAVESTAPPGGKGTTMRTGPLAGKSWAFAVVATAKGVAWGHPAYRAGVIAGAIRCRTVAPLTPRVVLKPPRGSRRS